MSSSAWTIRVGENDVGRADREGRREEVTDLLYTITNRHAKAASLEVFGRYPVSREGDIDVDVPRSATRADGKGRRRTSRA